MKELLKVSLLAGGDEWWFGKPGYYWLEFRDQNGKLVEKRYLTPCDKVKGFNGAIDLAFEYLKTRNDWRMQGSVNLKP